jgi:uncharacterized protein YjbJ (UPF0337 family)
MKGIMDEVIGTAKRKVGELTDNPQLQVEGMAQQVKGKVETAWGKTKEAVSEVLETAELHIDTHAQLKLKVPKADEECRKDT